MHLFKHRLIALIAGATLSATYSGAQTPAQQPDKYLWLEDVSGAKSMEWVKTHNDRTAGVLEKDPHYAALEAAELKVLESPERLQIPSINGSDIYNTWQDATHVRGILRRTSLDDYLTAQPHWQTLIDYDALGKQDNEKWVQKGRSCLYPNNEYCLIGLSAGGEDADTLREFNLKTGKFVAGGFQLSRSKQTAQWIDKDTLLLVTRLGRRHHDQIGLPVCRQNMEARSEAGRGERNLPWQ